MQEPTIYRAPVASVDSAEAPGEEVTGITGIQSMTVVDSDPDKSEDCFRDFVIPEDRKLGVFSTTILIINRVVGTGIYSTPSAIMRMTESVGATLIFWVLGGVMTFAGIFVYLEFGTALPRSGGEKVYLERVYQKPRYLATCIFAVQFVLFAVSTANSMSFASYVMRAATYDSMNKPDLALNSPNDWKTGGVAIAGITVVCLIHAFAPKTGIWLSNVLGCLKLIILMLVVCTGFAVLGGRSAEPSPHNFDSFNGPGTVQHNEKDQTNGYALALLQVLYSYSGWENANYVLTEVRDAPKTLKIAAPLAVSTVTVLYVLANIAFFAAMSKEDIASGSVTLAASFFETAWGKGSFTTRVVPLFIALSALGNIFAQSFAMPRVKQELAKEGILPFSRFFASDWPFNAPSGAIFLHWLFTVVLILALISVPDAYVFVTNIFIYTGNWIKLLLGVGLLYLRFKPSSGWAEQRTTFRSYSPLTMFWIASLLYSLSASFIPNQVLSRSVPWPIMPALGTGMLAIGVAYWLCWARLMPLMGFQIQHEVIQLPDGSERVKYVHVPSKRQRRSAYSPQS